MNSQTVCPPPTTLNELLSGQLREEDSATVTKHLDTCQACQVTLEQLAVGDTPVMQPQRVAATEKPSSDSAYWPAVEKLRSHLAVAETQMGVSDDTATDDDDEAGALDFLDPPQAPGSLGRLDYFDVVEKVGRGGMGIVLKAFDNCLHRYVAIKVLRPQAAAGHNAQQRFIREVRSAAAIRHENVVSIYYVDEVRDQYYLVMEFVPGLSLEQRLSEGRQLELKEILRIGMQLANGLSAAHAQGLVHRDVKPANILLDGDKIKITDFGLARAMEDGHLTQTGMVVGTPQYMAPEQAQGRNVDHRADLFSFGSVLYAMSTGKAPFGSTSTMATLLAVVRDNPKPIREINPNIPEWLVNIIDKLLQKDPADRFQSTEEVKELLGQHLCHLKLPDRVPMPVEPAAPRSWTNGVASFLGGIFGKPAPTSSTAIRAMEPASLPSRATLEAGTGPICSIAFSKNDSILAMALDDGTVKLWDAPARRVRATLSAHRAPVWSIRFSPVGEMMATASDDGTVKLWDATTFKELQTLKHSGAVRAVAFSHDGQRLATGNRDGSVGIWDLQSGQQIVTTAGHAGVIMDVAFSPDGKTIASASGDKTVRLWDAASGLEQVSLSGHAGGVYSVAFSADNQRVASGGWDKRVQVWDAGTGAKVATFAGHEQDVWSVAFSPNGRHLASGSEDRTVRIWDIVTGETVTTHRGHAGTIYSVAYSHDGRTIASGGRDGTVKFWDAD
ncbi:MAG: serine/threonine-protein kinase [Planctomycetota bacterium]|nr:serine/threonine-protein kinase [Planctomycetota bacterium]